MSEENKITFVTFDGHDEGVKFINEHREDFFSVVGEYYRHNASTESQEWFEGLDKVQPIDNLLMYITPTFDSYVFAMDGDRIVGYLIFRIMGVNLDIHQVAVVEDHRRQGIGRAMYDQIREYAKNTSSQNTDTFKTLAEVALHNESGQAFFKEMALVPRVAKLIGDYTNVITNEES